MRRSALHSLFLIVLLILVAVPSQAVVRTARQMNFIEFSAGYNMPWGEYNGVPTADFEADGRIYTLDVEDVYGSGPSFGIHYGRVAQGRLSMEIGFRYTHANLKDTIDYSPTRAFDFYGVNLNLYEGDVNLNLYLADLNVSSFAPYVGLGLQAGIASLSAEGYDSQNDFSSAIGLNFGADFTLMRNANDGSFMTLASINNVNIFASNDRPKNLTIGGGLRYYFRM